MNEQRIGVLVCFEGIFPQLARKYTLAGSTLLVNITNDAWFGNSSASHQGLAMVRFRAIENRIWVARAANTGISAVIAPSGKVLEKTQLFERAVRTARVGLGAEASFYTRFGDVLPSIFIGIVIFWLIGSIRNGKRLCARSGRSVSPGT